MNSENKDSDNASSQDAIQESIILSDSGLQIATDPFLVGPELLHLSKESSKDFLRSLDLDSLRGPYTVLNILRGGRYYRLIDAWNEVVNIDGECPLQLSEIRAKRQVNDDGTWNCKIWHDADIAAISEEESTQNLLSCNTLIIGDTIATGTTLIEVLRWFIDLRESNNTEHVTDIVIFSICGSSVAKKNLFPFYQHTLKPKGVRIQLVLANAGFKLDETNGTDLSLITTEMLPEAKRVIEDRVGVEFMESMKCAIWDWGDRFNSIHSHLKEVTEYFEQFMDGEDIPEHIRKSVEQYRGGITCEDTVDETALNCKYGEKRYSLVMEENEPKSSDRARVGGLSVDEDQQQKDCCIVQ